MRKTLSIILFTTLFNLCNAQLNPIDSILISIKEEKIDSNIFNAYLKIAEYYKDSAFDKTLDYYHKALDLVETTNERKKVASVYHSIGSMYLVKGELPSALLNYNNALTILDFLKEKEGVGRILNDIGLVYKTWGKYEKAIENFHRALNIFDETGNEDFIALVSNNIGQIYYYRNEFEKAIPFFKKYYDVNVKNKKTRAAAGAANNIASALMEQNKYDDALKYYVISMRIYDSLNVKVGVAVIKDNIGSLFIRKEQYNDALTYSSEASKIFQELGSQSRLCASLQNVGLAYTKLKKSELALKYLNQSLDLSIKLNIPETKKSVYETLSEVYSQKKDFEKALLNYKLFIGLKDSLVNSETIGKIESIQAEYESSRKEKELAEVTKKLSNQKILGLISVGVIILFLFLTSLIIRENQTKKSIIKTFDLRLNNLYKILEKINKEHLLQNNDIYGSSSFFNNKWLVKAINENQLTYIPFYKNKSLYLAFLSKDFETENVEVIKLAIVDFLNSYHNESHELSIKEQFSKFIVNNETWNPFVIDKQILNIDFWCFNNASNQHIYSGNISAFLINENKKVTDLSQTAQQNYQLKQGDRLFFCTSNSLNSFILSYQNNIQNTLRKTIEKSVDLNFEHQNEILENCIDLFRSEYGQNTIISILAIQV